MKRLLSALAPLKEMEGLKKPSSMHHVQTVAGFDEEGEGIVTEEEAPQPLDPLPPRLPAHVAPADHGAADDGYLEGEAVQAVENDALVELFEGGREFAGKGEFPGERVADLAGDGRHLRLARASESEASAGCRECDSQEGAESPGHGLSP